MRQYKLAADVPLTESGTLEAILDRHRAALGSDFTWYRHHAHRVATLCQSSARVEGVRLAVIGVAAACHDLGIWVAGTFDYLEPSVDLARDHLLAIDAATWLPTVATAIREHHRITPYAGEHAWLAEPFRRADWMDVSGGLVSSGLSHQLFRAALARWPRAGFHRGLVHHAWRHARRHPLDPLPMLKL
jgi:hypothetical protein